KQFFGQDYRVMVVDGEIIAAHVKTPPFVRGDGSHSVFELIKLTNEKRCKSEFWKNRLISDKEEDIPRLSTYKMNLNSIPDAGQIVYLDYNSSAAGGDRVDVTENMHEGF